MKECLGLGYNYTGLQMGYSYIFLIFMLLELLKNLMPIFFVLSVHICVANKFNMNVCGFYKAETPYLIRSIAVPMIVQYICILHTNTINTFILW